MVGWQSVLTHLKPNENDGPFVNIRICLVWWSSQLETFILWNQNNVRGPGSSVGIATACGLDGPEIESQWGEIFRNIPDRPWGPPSLLYNGYRIFPAGKVLPGRDADPSPPSSAEV